MPISQKQDAAQQQSEFKFYLAVEKLHQKVFSVSSLPPFKIERIGSNKSQLLGEVRRSLIKCFANWKPRTWAMPIPGSNPSFEPPRRLDPKGGLETHGTWKFQHSPAGYRVCPLASGREASCLSRSVPRSNLDRSGFLLGKWTVG